MLCIYTYGMLTWSQVQIYYYYYHLKNQYITIAITLKYITTYVYVYYVVMFINLCL